MTRRFFITDVFEHGPFTGNQLATVIDVDGLDTEAMLGIAREFDFSETTFLMGGDTAGGFDVRIFGPGGEMPFAGHPTLGTAWLIREHVERLETDRIDLNLGVGKIPVTFEDNGIQWMKQRSPEFGNVIARQEAAEGLGLSLEDIDADFIPQYVSTGLEFLLIPLASMEALKRCVIRDTLPGSLVFCKGSHDADQSVAARCIGALPAGGILEDPATGSANGCLASYIVEHCYFGSDTTDIRVGQGYEMGRPSTLHLRAGKSDGAYDINVGGRVRLVAEGELSL